MYDAIYKISQKILFPIFSSNAPLKTKTTAKVEREEPTVEKSQETDP